MRIFLELLGYFSRYSMMKVARGMQYRSDFFLGILISFTYSILSPIYQYLIITHSGGYPHWDWKQVMLLQGVLLLWMGIRDLFFGEVRGYVEMMVKGGDFDRLLAKPYPAIGLILSSGFYYQALGTIIAGFIVIQMALQQLSLTVSWFQVIIFAGFFLGGILLFITITIIYCILVIMITYMGRLGEILDKLLQFSNYPLEIFPSAARILLITVLPVAVWGYFPAEVLLNRLEVKSFFSLGFCLILFLTGLKLWNVCLKKYTSAGG